MTQFMDACIYASPGLNELMFHIDMSQSQWIIKTEWILDDMALWADSYYYAICIHEIIYKAYFFKPPTSFLIYLTRWCMHIWKGL